MSEEKRPEWMTSLAATVDPEDYLLGRKIDKTFELSQKEKAEQAKEARLHLLASDKLRLTGDPILDLERRKQALKYEIMTNPIKRKQMRDFLLKRERDKTLALEQSPRRTGGERKHAPERQTNDRISSRRDKTPDSNPRSQSRLNYPASSERHNIDGDRDSRRGYHERRESKDRLERRSRNQRHVHSPRRSPKIDRDSSRRRTHGREHGSPSYSSHRSHRSHRHQSPYARRSSNHRNR